MLNNEFLNFLSQSDKQEISDYVELTTTEWLEDGEDVLSYYALSHKMIFAAELIQSRIKEQVRKEIDKWKEKQVLGVQIKPFNSSKFQFDNSTAWITANDYLKIEKEKLKEIEDIAKKISTRVERIDESTGESLFIYPAIKLITETVQCKVL